MATRGDRFTRADREQLRQFLQEDESPKRRFSGKTLILFPVGVVASIALAFLISAIMQAFVGVVLLVIVIGLILSALV